jgi:hypothetical protein
MERRRFGLAAAGLFLALVRQAVAQQVPDTASVLIVSEQREIRFDAAALARLPAAEQEVAYETGRGPVHARLLGAPLWSVLQAAGVLDGMESRQRIRRVLKVAGRDGHVAAVALAEVDPDFAAKPVLLAWQRDGQLLPDGELRLALPGDRRGGRNVRDVVRITLE